MQTEPYELNEHGEELLEKEEEPLMKKEETEHKFKHEYKREKE